MENPNNGAPTKDPIKELFGPPPPRRPIPSKSFNTLVKIFSMFSDQNPFSSQFPDDSRLCRANSNGSSRKISDDLRNDVVVPRGEKEALPGSDTVEDRLLSANDPKANDEWVYGDFSKDVSSSGLKLIVDESGWRNETKTMDKVPFDEEGISTGMSEVDKVLDGLSGIERILMDDSYDFGAFQLAGTNVNFDISNDLSCTLNTDICGNKSTTVESSVSDKLTVDGKAKGEGEKNQKDVEVNRSGDETESRSSLSVIRKISDCGEAVNQYVSTCPEEAPRKQRKLGKDKTPQELLQYGGLTIPAQKSNHGGTVSNSIMKGNKCGTSSKEKTKKVKDTFAKGVNSGKSKLLVKNDESPNNLKPGGADHGKMMKQSAAAKKVGVNWPKRSEKIQYFREELLNLWKFTSVPEDILKIVRELDAEVHGKFQSPAAEKINDASGAKNGKLGSPTEKKKAEEEGSCIRKNKKRGSSSEARKEKKKKQRRKKRAEMDEKLGVKRLKLKTVVKPKVIQPCRHYLKGRCQEGEKCKFSHDVIPLTKSKPCCHFARHACMKGDDCPFDHQLSNYPCNSYATTGSCSRGDSCLFSHKISAKTDSETMAGVSNYETFEDQFDKSNSKQHLNSNASSSGIATHMNLKENIAVQTRQLAKAPRGLNFLSYGKSSLKDSGTHKEADSSQKIVGAVGTNSQPDIPKKTAVNLGKALIDTPASDTSQGTNFISFLRTSVAVSGDKKQDMYSFHRDSPSFNSFGKSDKVNSSHISNDIAGTSNQLNKGMPSKVHNICGTPTANPAPVNLQHISVSSSGGLANGNCAGKSQAALPIIRHPDSGIREQESANGSEKAVQRNLWGSPTSSGQCSTSTKVGVKNTQGSAQRALLSTLAFAAKFESGIKSTSAGSAKVVANIEGTDSVCRCKQNEPSKASAILEFLYSGGNKEKQ